MFRLESWLVPFLLTSNWNLKRCIDNCSIKNVTGLQEIPTNMPIKINKILNFYRTHRTTLILITEHTERIFFFTEQSILLY